MLSQNINGMKQLFLCLFTGLLITTACKKGGNNDDQPSNGSGKGVVTPVGTAEETTKSEKVIGVAGGSISSLDGKITVSVPAGA